MASDADNAVPVAYTDRYGSLVCAECACPEDRRHPIYDASGIQDRRCAGWCMRPFEEIAPVLRERGPSLVSPTVVDRETAYGSTVRLSFVIKVF